MRSALLSFSLLSPLRYTALHCSSLLSSSHISISFTPLSLSLPASLLHYALVSLLCITALCSIVWGNTVHSVFFFPLPELGTLWLLVEEESDVPGAPGLACLGLLGSVWAGEEERAGREGRGGGQRAGQVRASSARGSKGFTVVSVAVDGCPSRVMPWDLRAFRLLELEILSYFCPLGGAALILVPGKAAGHQWLHREEWAP